MTSPLTCDIHQLVEISFTEERFVKSPEVTLEDASNSVAMVGIVHHTEGVAAFLKLLLELCDICL